MARRKKRPVVADEPSAEPSVWWHHVAAVMALLLVNLGVYYQTLHLDFLSLDDPDYVVNNPRLDALNAQNVRAILTEPWFNNYAPLHILSYAMDVALAGGKSAFAMHLSNVLWHGWIACMVYLLAFTLRPHVLTALVAGLLFVVHPAHVEVVAWISSRKDLIATGFAALAMTCYVRWRRAGTRAWLWYVSAGLSFLLASAAKQSVVLLPAVMLVFDWLVEKRRGWAILLDKVPFGIVSLLFALQTWEAQTPTRIPFSLFTVAVTHFQNLWLLTGLGDYVVYRDAPRPNAHNFFVHGVVILGALALWVVPLLFRKARNPVYLALWLWILIHFVPPMTLNFTAPITDRYLFLSSVGACILLAAWIGRKLSAHPFRQPMGLLLVAVVTAVWTIRTVNYLAEWRDPRSLWYGAKAKSNSTHVFEFLGQVYQGAGDRMHDFVSRGQPLDVAAESRLAHAIIGDSARAERLVNEWRNNPLVKTNSIAYRDHLRTLTWQELEQAVKYQGTLSRPGLFLRRGRFLVNQGKNAEAIPELKTALALTQDSGNPRVHQEYGTHVNRAIGIAHWNMHNYREALRWYQEAQRIQQASGQMWIPTLDDELQRLARLAASTPAPP
jgi:hypothetical protein